RGKNGLSLMNVSRCGVPPTDFAEFRWSVSSMLEGSAGYAGWSIKFPQFPGWFLRDSMKLRRRVGFERAGPLCPQHRGFDFQCMVMDVSRLFRGTWIALPPA